MTHIKMNAIVKIKQAMSIAKAGVLQFFSFDFSIVDNWLDSRFDDRSDCRLRIKLLSAN